jgi:hypothetical protein
MSDDVKKKPSVFIEEREKKKSRYIENIKKREVFLVLNLNFCISILYDVSSQTIEGKHELICIESSIGQYERTMN